MEDFEVALLSLSALAYSHSQGKRPSLLIDRPLEDYLRQFRIFDLWDGVDVNVISGFEKKFADVPVGITNAAKVYAMATLPAPFVMLDTDAVLFEPLPEDFLNLDLGYAHLEHDPDFEFYPNANQLDFPQGFTADDLRNLNRAPILNMSLVQINHQEFQTAFLDHFFRICNEKNRTEVPPLNLMTFSEQKVAGYLCEKLGLRHGPLLSYEWSCREKEFIKVNSGARTISKYHHLWHQKKFLHKSRSLQATYFENLLETLEESIPGIKAEALLRIEVLKSLLPG